MAQRTVVDADSGYKVELDGERVTALIVPGGTILTLGEIVVFNGRFGAPEGTVGTVTKIRKPFANGLTSDVLDVKTRSGREVAHVKPKDLIEGADIG